MSSTTHRSGRPIELDTHDGSPSKRIEGDVSFVPGGMPAHMSRNVNRATVTAYVPAEASAAVIVCPGGGFHALSIASEGHDVASALFDRGIGAFVLEYRLIATPEEDEAFGRQMLSALMDPSGLRTLALGLRPSLIADGLAALDHVRRQGFARIGMLGFSAGGLLVTEVALEGGDLDFVASIYGVHFGDAEVPSSAPPLFLALADDEPLADVREGSFGLHRAWHAARRPVELHVYERGGHGFGMAQQGITADGWFDTFVSWMGVRTVARSIR